MTKKRKHPDPHPHTSHPEKRYRPSQDDDTSSTRHGRVNPQTGMRTAFPELEEAIDGDGGEFLGPALNGVDYLRMVRSEASGLPPWMSSRPPTDPPPNDPGLDSNSHSTPADHDSSTPHDSTSSAAYTTILLRYRLLRANLRCDPPTPSIPAPARTTRQWKHHLLDADPRPQQVRELDRATVMRLLALVRDWGLDATVEDHPRRGRRLGAWLWSLLGQLDDVGTLASEEVAVLREVAKKGVELRESMERREVAAEEEEEEEEEGQGDGGKEVVGVGDGEVEDVHGARERVLARLNGEGNTDETETQGETGEFSNKDEVENGGEVQGETDEVSKTNDAEDGEIPEVNDHEDTSDQENVGDHLSATVDIILTIVGECYGQRDLLALRKIPEFVL